MSYIPVTTRQLTKPLTLLALASVLALAGCNATQNSVFYQETPTAIKQAPKVISDLDKHLAQVKYNSQQSDLSYDIVKSLTVEVGPRIAGSTGDKKAVAWAEAKFAELGFDKIYNLLGGIVEWSGETIN